MLTKTTEEILLGHSPDPDDAAMFYAVAEGKIDLRGYRFKHILEDIQTLNERAARGELHVSAISIHAYAYVMDKYALMPCGASMGDGYGPVLIAKDASNLQEGSTPTEIRAWLLGKRVAIPGKLTSANLALQLCLGQCEVVVMSFDKIFDALNAGSAEAGLIIHEGQLTYRREGFAKIIDLGQWWTERTGLPLPLGGNVIRRDMEPRAQRDIVEIVRESIGYALEHGDAATRHSMNYARGLEEGEAKRFIGMYVNRLTLDYGKCGREAVWRFLNEAAEAGFIPKSANLSSDFFGECYSDR